MDYRVYCNGKSYILPDFNVIKDNSQTFALEDGVRLSLVDSSVSNDRLIINPISMDSPEIYVYSAKGYPISIFYDRGIGQDCLQSGYNEIYDYSYEELFGPDNVGAVLKVYRFPDYRTGPGSLYEWMNIYNNANGTTFRADSLFSSERLASSIGELVAILRLDIIDANGTLGWRSIPLGSLTYAGITLAIGGGIEITFSNFHTTKDLIANYSGMFYSLSTGWECVGFYFRNNSPILQSKVGWFEIEPIPGDHIEIFISPSGIYDLLSKRGLPDSWLQHDGSVASLNQSYTYLRSYLGTPWKFRCISLVNNYTKRAERGWTWEKSGTIIS